MLFDAHALEYNGRSIFDSHYDFINQVATIKGIVRPISEVLTPTRASSAYYQNAAGLLVAAGTDTSRFDYRYQGQAEGLLTEPATTNVCLRSQTFDNATWAKTNATADPDTETAPDGTTTADRIIEDTTNGVHSFRQTISFVSGSIYTVSLFVKKATRDYLSILLPTAGFGTTRGVQIDFTTGTAVSENSPTNSGIEALANGWYRIWVTATATATASAQIEFHPRNVSGSSVYTGVTNGIAAIVWGAQVEVASYPTSYIETTSASVARSADKYLLDYATLGFNEAEGTFVAEFSRNDIAAGSQPAFSVTDGTNSNRYTMVSGTGSPATMRAVDVVAGGVSQASIPGYLGGTASCLTKTAYRQAFSYNTDAISGVALGIAPMGRDTSATLPTGLTVFAPGGLGNGTAVWRGHVREIGYIARKVPDDFLVKISSMGMR